MEHEQGVEEMEEQKQMRGQLNRLRRLHTAVFAAAMRFMLLPSQAGTKGGWIGEREERAPGKVAATFGGDWATIYRRATAASMTKRTFLALITETNSKADENHEMAEKLRQKHQLKRLFHTV